MRPPTGNVITQGQHGSTKAVDHSWYRNTNDDKVYAPEDMTWDSYQRRGVGKNNAGNCLRMRGKNGLHQFAHLKGILIKPGQSVAKGQAIAVMGDTGYAQGKHLHYWIQRSNGSYVYPPSLYTEKFGGSPAPKPPAVAMPAIGSKVFITINRTAFKPGTTQVAGTIRPGGGYYYWVRGYDANYPGRIIINSASAGGTVAVALYYTNGQKIEGWR